MVKTPEIYNGQLISYLPAISRYAGGQLLGELSDTLEAGTNRDTIEVRRFDASRLERRSRIDLTRKPEMVTLEGKPLGMLANWFGVLVRAQQLEPSLGHPIHSVEVYLGKSIYVDATGKHRFGVLVPSSAGLRRRLISERDAIWDALVPGYKPKLLEHDLTIYYAGPEARGRDIREADGIISNFIAEKGMAVDLHPAEEKLPA